MYGRGKPPSVVWHGTGHECQKVKMYYQVSYVELQLLRGYSILIKKILLEDIIYCILGTFRIY